jgi:hypothetical protein
VTLYARRCCGKLAATTLLNGVCFLSRLGQFDFAPGTAACDKNKGHNAHNNFLSKVGKRRSLYCTGFANESTHRSIEWLTVGSSILITAAHLLFYTRPRQGKIFHLDFPADYHRERRTRGNCYYPCSSPKGVSRRFFIVAFQNINNLPSKVYFA